jgi:phytanoyl-CoA hydroxylase
LTCVKPKQEKNGMISDREVQTYKRDGVIVVPDVLGADTLNQLRSVIAELVAGSAKTLEHTDIYDLEPGHTAESPRVRRIKAPQKVHPLFDEIVRSASVLDILTKLIGPALRLHGSKLNMKSAQYGSPVEWHQDWAFYPHTNDDILAIGVLLDDCDLSNGPMLVTPGTHTGEVWNHHGDDGCFAGLIDPDLIKSEIERAVPCMGRAGSMSFHHVRALHGSALNTSDRSRNLLLYEVAASDAWPLMGVKDFAEFNSHLLTGDPVVAPRMTGVPVRLPLPPATRQGSIYETQSAAKKSYFTRAA